MYFATSHCLSLRSLGMGVKTNNKNDYNSTQWFILGAVLIYVRVSIRQNADHNVSKMREIIRMTLTGPLMVNQSFLRDALVTENKLV